MGKCFSEFSRFLILFSIIIFVSGFFLLLPKFQNSAKAEVAYWYSADWQYRKEITINHSYVSENVSDFVFLVSIDADNDLKNKAQADGGDIVFTSSNGTTELPYQFETYESATGKLVAWVKIPEIFSSVNTKVYLYYGNSSCANQEDATSVWTNGEVAVWHLEESGVSSRLDSTAYANNGTQFGGVSSDTGVIEGANSFDGLNDYLSFENSDSLNPGIATLSTWAKFPRSGFYDGVLMHDLSNEHQRAWMFRKTNTNKAQVFFFRDYLNWVTVTGTSDIADNEWHNLAGSWDGITAKLYVDGLLEGSEPFSGTLEHVVSEKVYIAQREGTRYRVVVDEARIYDRAISAGNVYAQYNNQKNPATFYSLGSEMEIGVTAPNNVAEVFGYNSNQKTTKLISGETYSYANPYFEWQSPTEPDGVVAGYYVYFGPNPNADPANEGVFQEGNNFSPSGFVSGSNYYLIIQTRNIFPTNYLSNSRLFFVYKYENVLTELPKTGCLQ